MRLVAGEYTASGLKLLRLLAAAEGLRLSAGRCDLGPPALGGLEVPPGALVFTSYAACYVLEAAADLVAALCAWRPRAVIHFEPCYEHCDPRTLLGLMRRRYIDVNGYNRNLVTLLHRQQERGVIRILKEQPAVFGANPLLAASVLVWSPAAGRADTAG
jgi:hypothetical protein